MNSHETNPRFVRSPEACRILSCGKTHLYQMTRKGELTAIRRGRRMTVYDLRELDAIADRWTREAREVAA